MKRPPLKLFFSYAHEDRNVRDELDKHLDILEREGLVTVWWDGEITPGARWSEAIAQHLRSSDIIIFLVSKWFFQSEFIRANELPVALALEREFKGQKRVISVIVERTDAFEDSELSDLQRVPTGDRTLCESEDRTQTLHHVIVDIRRAVMEIIIGAGGPFEFGPHAFTQAELAHLEPEMRARTGAGLQRLRAGLVNEVPQRSLDKNLLLASWCLSMPKRTRQTSESFFYLAQIISAFDIVSLQKIPGDLSGVRALIDILGPEWGFVITDVTLGAVGANERFAILYYRPRVVFRNISGGIVLPSDLLIDGRQFARTPLLASFGTGNVRLRVCAAHIRYGDDPRLRSAECERLAYFLGRIADRDKEEILLTGDFNLLRGDSPVLALFRKHGVDIPPETVHRTLWMSGKPCDLIGRIPSVKDGPDKLARSRSGMIEIFDRIYRDRDVGDYAKAVFAASRSSDRLSEGAGSIDYKLWKKRQISDHLPIWVEYTLT